MDFCPGENRLRGRPTGPTWRRPPPRRRPITSFSVFCDFIVSQGISNGNSAGLKRALASARRELNRAAAISTDKLPARFNGTPCENDDREIKRIIFRGIPATVVRNKTRPGLGDLSWSTPQRWIALDRPDNGSLGHGLPWNRDDKLIRRRLPTDFNGLCK